MDFANRGNRPMQTPQQQMGPQNEQHSSHSSGKKKRGGFNIVNLSAMLMLFSVVAIVVALIVGIVFGGQTGKDEADLIQTDKYQAVFLNSQDGQVYFGKLTVYNKDLYALTDIYYVRVESPIQPEGAEQASQKPNISLAKLGNELHGPQDMMFVARDKVLYWENLKDDGQVVSAITEYKANGSKTTNPSNDSTSN